MEFKDQDSLAGKPKWEIAEIFRRYYPLLGSQLQGLTAKVVHDIIDCRTAKLGGHVRQCSDCRHEQISYNSCRNRHCPKCQFLARARWIDARIRELLAVAYFHGVFTLSHVFNPLFLANKKILYDLLFAKVSETLIEVGHSHLDAQIGFIAVLHTWDQKLSLHPHLHLLIPGGGLRTNSLGEDQWVPTSSEEFLFPVRILSRVFQGKFLSGLQEVRTHLQYPGDLARLTQYGRFKNLLERAASQRWEVYAKPPFQGPEDVIRYLGNYTHRIAISNYRILDVHDDHVRFRYRDSADGDKQKTMTLHVQEFMRRFLLHVLPHRFVRLRSFGFLGNRCRKEKIRRLKILLPLPTPVASPAVKETAPSPERPHWMIQLKDLIGLDLLLCPGCKKGEMREIRVIESLYDRRRKQKQPLSPIKGWDP